MPIDSAPKQVSSDSLTLSALVEGAPQLRFFIPIYQRLYVWGDEQVKTLLEDLYSAFQRHPDSTYFLGGTLALESEDGLTLELIDGQQRFTTLWLIGAAWPTREHRLQPFLFTTTGESRLQFAIRPEVNRYFFRLATRETLRELPAEVKATEPLHEAVATVQEFLKGKTDLEAFSAFLFRQVELVLTKVARATDLNLLFETINNRGVQLQHHEILKARMLASLLPMGERIGDSGSRERAALAMLWDACAEMDQFVERALGTILREDPEAGGGVSALAEPALMENDRETLADGRAVLAEVLRRRGSSDGAEPELGIPLEEILSDPPATSPSSGLATGGHAAEFELRSTMGFSMFLQHALRIWLQGQGRPDLPHIADRELVHLFDEHFFAISEEGSVLRAEHVTNFIQHLWELRYLYDKHVIKWINAEGEMEQRICPLQRSEGHSLRRRHSEDQETRRGFALLQSMLYHSQAISTQYWLTPLLAYMQRARTDVADYFRYFRVMENELFCSGHPEGNLAERTYELLARNPAPAGYSVPGVLREPKGTDFGRYWFYKLDFVLWWQGPEAHLGSRKPEWHKKWREFRFTARNSVEHVVPQTRSDRDRPGFDDSMLDRFGNLGLVSRSVNSAFGNKPFAEKQAHFEGRAQAKLDSLKLAHIYSHQANAWVTKLALEHEDRMLKALGEYLSTE